jgi:hypothetical protein
MANDLGRLRILAVALSLLSGCAGAHTETNAGKKVDNQAHDIREVLEAHAPRLLAIDGVVGVGRGQCNGAPCLKVMVRKKTPDLTNKIGSHADGYRIKLIETGKIRALDQN